MIINYISGRNGKFAAISLALMLLYGCNWNDHKPTSKTVVKGTLMMIASEWNGYQLIHDPIDDVNVSMKNFIETSQSVDSLKRVASEYDLLELYFSRDGEDLLLLLRLIDEYGENFWLTRIGKSKRSVRWLSIDEVKEKAYMTSGTSVLREPRVNAHPNQ